MLHVWNTYLHLLYIQPKYITMSYNLVTPPDVLEMAVK